MSERFYLVEVTTTSQGTEDRHFTPYDSYETALRKFYEVFTKVGAGPQKICATILNSDLFEIKYDKWEKPNEPEDEPSEE